MVFDHADAHPFEPAVFGVALSHIGAMFFGDTAAAHKNIARALRPGGQVVSPSGHRRVVHVFHRRTRGRTSTAGPRRQAPD